MSLIGVALVLTALFWLAAITFVFVRQTFFIVPRTQNELIQLNSRRAGRVREALAIGDSVALPETESVTVYPFSGWLDLEGDGTVAIAGESFQLNEAFQIEATDRNNISRVRAESRGTGEIFIISFGQFFLARFVAVPNSRSRWVVLEVPKNE